jgi:hypothetical protein
MKRNVPSKGYIPGNVCVISSKANRIKDNASIEEMTSLLKWLKEQIEVEDK